MSTSLRRVKAVRWSKTLMQQRSGPGNVGGGANFDTGNDSTRLGRSIPEHSLRLWELPTFTLHSKVVGNGSSADTYFDDLTVTDLTSTNTPAINIGTANAQAINIGNSRQTSSTTIQGGAGGLNLLAGNGATVNVGTGNGNLVNIGEVGSTTNESQVNIATSTGNAQLVNVGSTAFESATTIQAGTGGVSVTTGNAASGDSGAILIQSGDATSGTSGNVIIDTGASAVSAGSNLEHDTFETGTDGYSGGYNYSGLAQSTTFAKAGTNSLTFTTTDPSWSIFAPWPGPTVTPGTTYHVSMWIRGTSAGTVALDGQWYGGTNPTSHIAAITSATTSGWTQISGDVTAPAGVTALKCS